MQVANVGPSSAPIPWACGLPVAILALLDSAHLSLACCTDGSSRCVARRITLRCLWRDAPAHDHHRRAAAPARQFGAFAQGWLRRSWLHGWRLRGGLYARRAGGHAGRCGAAPCGNTRVFGLLSTLRSCGWSDRLMRKRLRQAIHRPNLKS